MGWALPRVQVKETCTTTTDGARDTKSQSEQSFRCCAAALPCSSSIPPSSRQLRVKLRALHGHSTVGGCCNTQCTATHTHLGQHQLLQLRIVEDPSRPKLPPVHPTQRSTTHVTKAHRTRTRQVDARRVCNGFVFWTVQVCEVWVRKGGLRGDSIVRIQCQHLSQQISCLRGHQTGATNPTCDQLENVTVVGITATVSSVPRNT